MKKMATLLSMCLLGLTLAGATSRSAAALILDRKEAASIGEEAEDSLKIQLVNGTEKKIEELALRVDEGEYSENLLPEGESFLAGEERTWFLTPSEGEEGKAPVYDLKVTFEKEEECVLHTLPIGDTEEIVLHYQKGVTYVIFESKDLNKTVNTLEQEKELSPKKAPAQTAQTDSSASYAYTTGSESTYEPAYTAETYSYTQDTGSYAYEPTYETPSYESDTSNIGSEVDVNLNNLDFGTGSGDDNCLDDGTLLN